MSERRNKLLLEIRVPVIAAYFLVGPEASISNLRLRQCKDKMVLRKINLQFISSDTRNVYRTSISLQSFSTQISRFFTLSSKLPRGQAAGRAQLPIPKRSPPILLPFSPFLSSVALYIGQSSKTRQTALPSVFRDPLSLLLPLRTGPDFRLPSPPSTRVACGCYHSCCSVPVPVGKLSSCKP